MPIKRLDVNQMGTIVENKCYSMLTATTKRDRKKHYNGLVRILSTLGLVTTRNVTDMSLSCDRHGQLYILVLETLHEEGSQD